MSWIDRIQTDFTIATGDAKTYAPQWLNASKGIDYNIATFEFKELAGTLVHRGTPRGTRYNIELYFTGDDHLQTAADFETSAANPKAWTMSHPFYGSLLVQPVGLIFDNADYNVTKITGQIIETIATDGSTVTQSAPDKIAADKVITDDAAAQAYTGDAQVMKVADIQTAQAAVNGFFYGLTSKIDSSTHYSEYLNLYNQGNSLISAAGADTFTLMQHLQEIAGFPALVTTTVQNRIRYLGREFDQLGEGLASLITKSQKSLYQALGTSIITSMLLSAVTGTTDSYGSRGSVLAVIGSILSAHARFISNLDTLQSLNGGSPLSFLPNAVAITALSQLVGYTVSALLAIAANSKQERVLTLEEDSNIILVAFRLYGLQADDSTITALMDTNDIGLNEVLSLKKGRKITYYV